MTLTEFLLARVAEDEAVAEEQRVHDISTCHTVWHDRLGQLDHEWMYCECDWPARVLAECEAKRRIVELHNADRCMVCAIKDGDYPDAWGDEPPPCRTLRLLALPYAGHPDYRDEWRMS